MTDIQTRNDQIEQPRLEDGVFQPSRAEIARVMESRLYVADEEPASAVPDRR